MVTLKFKSTADIKVPNRIVDQVIGQDEAVEVIKKAAQQRRHVLLIGEPGTGKSMLGLALAELLPMEKLADIMSASSLLVLILFMIGFSFSLNLGRRVENKVKIPRVIVDNFRRKQAPFNDATGAHAGALLGDVLHDPFQSGGLG